MEHRRISCAAVAMPTSDEESHTGPGHEAEDAESPPASAVEEPSHSFPIVGIGASAGGLHALESFLGNIPDGSGMAFVIIQHQDPTREGMLVGLLGRSTTMPVVAVSDRMRVEPDSVYVIPPDKDMSILHGVLHLLDPVAPRGLRLPIDGFLRTLADDQREKGVGVILSGMGSDGTLGLRAIREKGGATFVQEPTSAGFDGMPRSAINAGLADVVAPAEELPGRISTYAHHALSDSRPGNASEETDRGALEKVVILLRTETGHDFSLYKRSTVHRRIDRRRGLHQIPEMSDYVRFLQQNPQEVELLFRELLIGVTRFFRDPESWEQLKAKALAALLNDGRPAQLRAWVPACSTGEEAYSLAILFREAVEEFAPSGNFTLQVFATDLDEHAIVKARTGEYPHNVVSDVSPKRLDRFFVELEDGYRLADSIREMVIFAKQNIVMDPPFSRLDLVSCRNLLIYLDPKLQEQLLKVFHYSLNDSGYLFLGSAETVGDLTSLFEPVDRPSQLHRRVDSGLRTEPIEFPIALGDVRRGPRANRGEQELSLEVLAGRLLLKNYSPAAALTNSSGDILYVNGHTGKYLEAPAGKANWNIFAMAREGLRAELLRAFKKALRKKETVVIKNAVVITPGGRQTVNVSIHPIGEPGDLQGRVIFVFENVTEPSQAKTTGKPGGRTLQKDELKTELGLELERANQELQSMQQEMQARGEELRSANEELQSANEEMQSTNEELTTSKEELQSMNEELHTINQELQTRLGELSQMDSDMRNLLESTGIATLFLDEDLCVRRFTHATRELIKLIPMDVGRPVSDIASALLYPELADDAREVMKTSNPVEREVSTSNGKWLAAHVMPYWTVGNSVTGVVITFTDITCHRNVEVESREKRARLKDGTDGS